LVSRRGSRSTSNRYRGRNDNVGLVAVVPSEIIEARFFVVSNAGIVHEGTFVRSRGPDLRLDGNDREILPGSEYGIGITAKTRAGGSAGPSGSANGGSSSRILYRHSGREGYV
jgi:hypothetical protein